MKKALLFLVCIIGFYPMYAQLLNMGQQSADSNDSTPAIIYTMVEEMPEYPGGDEAMRKFIADHLIYPKSAMDSAISGTVYVTFVVDYTGKVRDVKILRGIGGGCDEEVFRIVQSMPDWKPGKQYGKPVNVQFNLPVKFSLNDNELKDAQSKGGSEDLGTPPKGKSSKKRKSKK